MTTRYLVAFVAVVAAALLVPASEAGQAKTPWGDPDLQGGWSYATLTPLERPDDLAGKEVFTDEEAAEFIEQTLQRRNADRRDEDGSRGGFINGTVQTSDLARAYNEFWWDKGTAIVGTNRTSLIVDPPDGKLPALTPEAQKRVTDRTAVVARPAHGIEDRPLGERCIHQQRTGPPMMPGGYNNNMRLFQRPGYVAILTEQIHEVRVIPLDGRPHLGDTIRQWKGDSRGHWEGDTLVVDTVNFNGKTSYRGAGKSLHLTERFTRVNKETLDYQYTIDDPESFTSSWTVQLPMTRDEKQLFEYACHEGNYGIEGSLSGARAVDRAAAAAGTGSR